MIGNFHLQNGKVEFRWRRWRNKKRQEVASCLMVLLSGGGVAEAGPTGIRSPAARAASPMAARQTFSTGLTETVDFKQPNPLALAINYVIGGVPLVLREALNASGRVYILNSAGRRG